MATVTAFEPLDMTRLAEDFAAVFELPTIYAASETEVALNGQNSLGALWRVELVGAGFNSDVTGGYPTTGTITTLENLSFYFLPVGEFGFWITQPASTISDISLTTEELLTAVNSAAPHTLGNLLFSGDDTFTGSYGDDVLFGYAGDDTISGGDELFAEPMIGDAIDGGIGADVIHGDGGADTIVGGQGADQLFGGADNDILAHDGGSLASFDVHQVDDVRAEDGEIDVLDGGGGNDVIYAGLADVVDGGDGLDRLEANFSESASGLTLDLSVDAQAALSVAGIGSIVNVEQFAVRGTAFADVVTATAAADGLFGGKGGDRLDGGLGDDVLSGADYSADAFVHGNFGSRFDDGVRDDLLGGDGSDAITAGLLDYADGGGDADSLSVTFVGLGHGVTLDLTTGDVWATLSAATGGSLTGFEVLQSLHATRYADTVSVAGATRVYAFEGNDVVTGDSADQRIYTGAGADQAYGGAGSDWLLGGTGNDRLFGGDDADFIFGDDGGPGGRDYLDGGAGDDYIDGGAGDDIIIGGAGGDGARGGEGVDTLSYAASASGINIELEYDSFEGIVYLHGFAGDALGDGGHDIERFIGSAFDDVMIADGSWSQALPQITFDGADGNDLLIGSFGHDLLIGGRGNDRLDGGSGGHDILNGGAGVDVVSFGEMSGSSGVKVDLLKQGVQTIGSGSVTLTAIEGVLGTHYGDVIRGNDGANLLTGVGGADTISGGGGADTIYGDGSGYGSEPDPDADIGNPDTLRGDAGNDIIYGGAGNDLVVGGDDNDQLFGQGGADKMAGGLGRDRLEGGLGNDILRGEGGADSLYGGAGADRFIYDALSDSLGSSRDVIYDFNAAEGDRIDLRPIDANPLVDGDQGFTLVSNFTGAGAEARVTYSAGADLTYLTLDVDGDGVVDFALAIAGNVTSGWLL